MCFSATASFSAGIVLTVIGVASIKKTTHKSQLLFAGIPIIFGIQQIAEGILWVSLPNPDLLNTQKYATYVFLLFAQIIWPSWVPLAILKLEKRSTRKTIQRFFVGAGLLVACYLAYCLLVFKVEAKIIGQHIAYIQDYPVVLRKYVIPLYAIATIAPSFFSHIKRLWLLGLSIAISYIITVLFYEHYILSVWCFFSSIISIAIYIIMIEISNEEKLKKIELTQPQHGL